MGKLERKTNPWTVALIIAGVFAIVESIAGALFYRDLPLGIGRFFVVYFTAYAAAAAFLSAVLAAFVALIWKRRAAAIAVGVGLVWFIIFALRGWGMVRICSTVGASDLSLMLFLVAAMIGSVVVGVIAYFIGRYAIGRIRFSLLVIGILAIIACVVFLSRPKLRPAVQTLDSVVQPEFPSPINPHKPNILLITIDTLRADHTSPYGYARDTTPNLQTLAEQGVLFERCITQRTSTASAVASLLTGMYPPMHRVFNNNNTLQDFNVTMAEILAREGYVTSGVCGNMVCGEKFNFDQGFSYFQMLIDDGSKEQNVEHSRAVNRLALKWLEAHHSGRFFLWVHYMDPHTPYIVPDEFKNLYTGDELASANQHRQLRIRKSAEGGLRPNTIVDGSRDQDFYISQYDAEIRFNDQSMGELFDVVRRLGIWDNTLIIVTADHGESLGEHDYYFSHGAYCYEPCAHVPLVFAHPSLPAGARVTVPVSLMDVLPTIRDLLSLPTDSSLQGESLATLLVDAMKTPSRRYHYILGSWRDGYQTHGVTTDRYKLVFDVDERLIYMDVGVEILARWWFGKTFPNKYRFRAIKRELYDLLNDPSETVNIAGQSVAVQKELETNLWEWIEAVYRAGSSHDIQGEDLTPDLLEKLRGLGYVQ